MRHLSAALVGAIVVFIWGFLAWAAIPIWGFPFGTPANEDVVLQTLADNCVTSGAYYIPDMPKVDDSTPEGKAAWDTWSVKHQQGPLALVLVNRSGSEPMAAREMAMGFGIEFVCALLLTCVLSGIDGDCKRRARVGQTIALFMATAIWGVQWNFMHLPGNYILANWLDAIIAWSLCSIAIAYMLSRKQAAAA